MYVHERHIMSTLSAHYVPFVHSGARVGGSRCPRWRSRIDEVVEVVEVVEWVGSRVKVKARE
jgi:hypothetical protein